MKNKNNLHRKVNRITKENLEGFVSMAQSDARILSMTRIALNLPVFLDLFADSDDNEHGFMNEAADELLGFLSSFTQGEEASLQIPDSKAVSAAREKNIACMKVLSAYADRFTIYEYILNRLEYRFFGGTLAADYSDENMTQEILQRLSKEEDQTVRQSLITSVIEQLPMRMTKTKFYQVIQEGLDAYKGSDRNAVDGIIELLRTAAMLGSSANPAIVFPEFEKTAVQFHNVQYSTMTKEQWEQLSGVLKDAMELLNVRMELGILYQELLNDILVTSLTKQAVSHRAISDSCRVITYVLQHGTSEAEEKEDILARLYEPLEGVQEQYTASFEQKSALIAEYCEEKSLLESYGLTEAYQTLDALTKLISSSRFAELTEEIRSELVEPEYVEQQAARLIRDLDASFAQSPKLQNRAVMAKLITMLPLFVRDYAQLEAYIRSSLSSCSDVSEKLACIEIIRAL